MVSFLANMTNSFQTRTFRYTHTCPSASRRTQSSSVIAKLTAFRAMLPFGCFCQCTPSGQESRCSASYFLARGSKGLKPDEGKLPPVPYKFERNSNIHVR